MKPAIEGPIMMSRFNHACRAFHITPVPPKGDTSWYRPSLLPGFGSIWGARSFNQIYVNESPMAQNGVRRVSGLQGARRYRSPESTLDSPIPRTLVARF